MSFLKKRWYIPVAVVVVLFAVIGVYVVTTVLQPSEPKMSYVMPKRTTTVERSAQVARLPQSDKTTLVEPHDHEPTVKLVDEVVEQMVKESLEDNPVVEPQQDEIGEIEEVSDIDTAEPKSPSTLGDIMKSNGMSDSDILEITNLLPLNPNIRVDQTGEFVAHLLHVADVIDQQVKHDLSSLSLEKGRAMVEIMKQDPTMTAEEFREIIQDYFPVHIQDALRKEGVLQ